MQQEHQVMQKFKHLAVSTPLAWTHGTHERTHAYITTARPFPGSDEKLR